MNHSSSRPESSIQIQSSARPPSQESTISSASHSMRSLSQRSQSNFETQESDVEEIDPKIEEISDSPRKLQMTFETEHLTSPTFISLVGNTQAKKRGRPRKSTDGVRANQNSKLARCKTGCKTCRRRKKKCDEAKPESQTLLIIDPELPTNIGQVGIVRKTEFSAKATATKKYGSREKTPEGEALFMVNPPRFFMDRGADDPELVPIPRNIPRPLQSITPGIESDVDVKLLDHYFYDLSNVLTVHNNVSNPFKDIIFRMAIDDGENLLLRHSLLCFAGLHLCRRDPKKIFNDRQEYHYEHYLRIAESHYKKAIADPTNVQSIITSAIVQCLIAICRGSTNGEYRWHMDIVRELLPDNQSSDPVVQDFFNEFLLYHDGLNVVTSLNRRPASVVEEDGLSTLLIETITPDADGVFFGVKDGLLKIIIRIARLRDRIRLRMFKGILPLRDYPIMNRGWQIEQDLKAWTPVQEPYTPSWHFAWFHHRCIWIYLYRTLTPSKPSEGLALAVDEALESLGNLHSTESIQSVLLLPLFLLSCAAFMKEQRPPIELAFENVRRYSMFGNIDQARTEVRIIWELMDAGDERSWDWERVMADRGIDLLIT